MSRHALPWCIKTMRLKWCTCNFVMKLCEWGQKISFRCQACLFLWWCLNMYRSALQTGFGNSPARIHETPKRSTMDVRSLQNVSVINVVGFGIVSIPAEIQQFHALVRWLDRLQSSQALVQVMEYSELPAVFSRWATSMIWSLALCACAWRDWRRSSCLSNQESPLQSIFAHIFGCTFLFPLCLFHFVISGTASVLRDRHPRCHLRLAFEFVSQDIFVGFFFNKSENNLKKFLFQWNPSIESCGSLILLWAGLFSWFSQTRWSNDGQVSTQTHSVFLVAVAPCQRRLARVYVAVIYVK